VRIPLLPAEPSDPSASLRRLLPNKALEVSKWITEKGSKALRRLIVEVPALCPEGRRNLPGARVVM